MSTEQCDVKVEWDPERYEESMAAIEAWDPFFRFRIMLIGDCIQIGDILDFKIGRSYRVNNNSSVHITKVNRGGLIVNLDKTPFVQIVKHGDLIEPKIKRMFVWGLTPEQDILLMEALNKDIEELSLVNSSIDQLKNIDKLSKLTSLNLRKSRLLSDISELSNLTQLISLDLSNCTSLTDASVLSNLTQLTSLDLSHCDSLTDVSVLSNLTSLTSLDLSHCKSLTDLSMLSQLTQLTSFDLSGCTSLTDLSMLSQLTQLTSLDLSDCTSLTDLSMLSQLTRLTSLNIAGCIALSTSLNIAGGDLLTDVSMLSQLTQLTSLDLAYCDLLTDVSGLSQLTQLISLDLSGCESLTDVSGLSQLTQLISLDLSNCTSLTDMSGLSNLIQLPSLNLSGCESLTDVSGLSQLTQLTSLNLSGCESLTDVSGLSNLTQLTSLDLRNCSSLTDVSGLSQLPQLQSLDLLNCGEIHSIEPLSNLPNLRELTWITPSKVSEVLLASALLRSDAEYIGDHITTWLQHFSLVKEPERFFRRLCDGVKLLADADRWAELAERGRAFTSTQLDLRAWRYWAQQTLTLPSEGLAHCFQVALKDLDSVDALEGRGAGVIGAMGQLADNKPAWALDMVARTLSVTLDQEELRRTIAPAAASFYAQWGEDKLVAEWIKHGTHPEAPIWRDRVLLALVEWASDTLRWEEAGRYLAEIETDELRDKAHFELGTRLIAEEPARVALHHLSQLVDEELRTQLALQLSEQGELYTHPSALSRLILTLQTKPALLGDLLSRLIAEQPASVDTLTSLLGLHSPSSGAPSSDHPALTKLNEIDLNTMTPMAALQVIYELKESL